MSSIQKCLAHNIRHLRKERGLTQAELAEKAGVSTIFIHGIESEKKWISPATTKALAKAFQVSESKLFENCFDEDEAWNHIPRDIFQGLSTTCRHPKWKWEAFRWILEGFSKQGL